MPFALRIFRINIHNSYYQAQVGDDFSLVPTEASQEWMQRYRMRLGTNPGTFELLWVAASLAHPLETLKEKASDKKLTFRLILKNPSVLGFSELSIDRGQTYYFHNQGATSKLYQAAYVSQADKIPVQETISHLGKLEKPFFGIVDIHLKELWHKRKLTVNKLPIDYQIHIKAKETI